MRLPASAASPVISVMAVPIAIAWSSNRLNSLKVLSMRLRGAKTELEDAGESTEGMAVSTSKLREDIKALTNVNGTGGFDIMKDSQNFKSTYEIMKGIANVWNDLTDTSKAAVIEKIAGRVYLNVQKCA